MRYEHTHLASDEISSQQQAVGDYGCDVTLYLLQLLRRQNGRGMTSYCQTRLAYVASMAAATCGSASRSHQLSGQGENEHIHIHR